MRIIFSGAIEFFKNLTLGPNAYNINNAANASFWLSIVTPESFSVSN